LLSAAAARVLTVAELGSLLRELRRREAREHGGAPLTYRELAAKTGWSRGSIGEYFSGRILPPTDRFDHLIVLLGATPDEQRALATARDRVEERRRGHPPTGDGTPGSTATPVEGHDPVGVPVPNVAAAGTVVDAVQVAVLPRQLPADVAGFSGRSADLARLDQLLDAGAITAALSLGVVSGTAGVGKTALAVHWAHRVADRFPDGQLFVNLCGYDVERAVAPETVLAEFLRALGVDSSAIPWGRAERAALYRTLLHGRRMLVLLDNASDEEQVRPLLPGSGSCFVVVTSRDRLSGLAVREGAHRVDVDLLSPTEAVDLLGTLVGTRVDAEPAAAVTLAEQCARLPLVLRVAAELAAVRSGTPVSELVAELTDERRRLDMFDAAVDERSAVRTVFEWSYRRLPAAAARLFRLLGLHPGADIDGYALAALAGADVAASRTHLDVLIQAHLIRESRPGRYRMHDLLRAYAAERSGTESEADRRAALARLLGHYLAGAAEAMDILYPAERHHRPPPPAPTGPVPPLGTEELARAWLDAERSNLVAATVLAADQGWPAQAGQLAATLNNYLNVAGHFGDTLTTSSHALRAARLHGDHRVEALACYNLGGAYMLLADYDQAVEYFRQALAGYEATGDIAGTARALSAVGWVHAERGGYAATLDHYQQALARYQEAGDRLGVATMLGWVGLELGRAGRLDESLDHFRRARSVCREIRAYDREVEVLSDLGQVLIWAGRYTEMLEPTREAIVLTRQIGDRVHEPDLLINLAESLAATGRAKQALTHYRSALALARKIGQRHSQARAGNGIARLLYASGQPDRAREHWQDSLAIYTALRMPEAQQVRAALADLDEAV
jgi:tetratricopeptide (TPR) repeat protein